MLVQSRIGRTEQLVNVCFVCHSTICICLTTAHRGPPLIEFSPGQDEGLTMLVELSATKELDDTHLIVLYYFYVIF